MESLTPTKQETNATRLFRTKNRRETKSSVSKTQRFVFYSASDGVSPSSLSLRTALTEDYSVDIEGEASCTGKIGVEMEAMTAVSVAGLTVYDMCKAASKDISITDVRLELKTGGKSGYWSRGE